MNEVKISVIVPIYNVEKYLKKCLNSIINQSFREIEIICVNDGSTDNSIQILDEFARIDSRIKVINKENRGVGAARKTGLDHSTGEYVEFVDSDDWLEKDALKKTYQNAVSNGSDVVLFSVNRYNEYNDEYLLNVGVDILNYFNNETIDYNNFNFNYKDIKPFLMNNSFSVWSKLYKHDFLKSHDFYFPEFLNFEDVPFHVQVLLFAKKISFCPGTIYYYRTSNDQSLSNSARVTNKVFDIFEIINKVESILIETKNMDEFKLEFSKFKVSQLSHWLKSSNVIFKENFFKLVKQNFEKMDLKEDELNNLDIQTQNIYNNVINSNSNRELELLEEKFELLEKLRKQEIDSLTTINNQKQSFINQLNSQKQLQQEQLLKFNEKLKIQRIEHKNELKDQSSYYKENMVCLQKKIDTSNSRNRSLEQDLNYLKYQMEIVANTKPYRIAYLLRRFSLEFVNGGTDDKKDFLKWSYSKLTKKESGTEYRYNPLIQLVKK